MDYGASRRMEFARKVKKMEQLLNEPCTVLADGEKRD